LKRGLRGSSSGPVLSRRRSGLLLPPAATGWFQLEHRDPADRLLIATAIELASPLVTYDERILRFASAYGRQYGFSAST